MVRSLLTLAAAAVISLAAAGAEAQRPAQDAATCTGCHGELELLRQNAPNLARARELLVTPAHIQGTGHDGMQCAECHTGYSGFPHPRAARTATCASCHEAAERAWTSGRHSTQTAQGGIAAACTGCHGVHEVAPAAALAEGEPMNRVNARCTACHQTDALPASDPHAGTVGCWTCHGEHDVHAKADPAAAIAPLMQARTCGVCHDTASTNWRRDAHGAATLTAFADHGGMLALPAERNSPVCTACHGGHGMHAVESPAFEQASVDTCAGCHRPETRTFFNSYHGKATALGSRVSAACHDCHASHGVFGVNDTRSMVHSANLKATCEGCHEEARPAFLLYDAHPDPFDRNRNPWIFYSFWFMNTLLFGVMGVFGLHTVMWWVRLYIDKRRGILHGPGHHHHPHGHGPDARHTDGRPEP